jgi:hypothetical protein
VTGTPGPEGSGGRAQDRFDRPIFIISTPRSGSTLLFETLRQAPNLYTTGNESHGLIERISGLSPADHEWRSNRLGAADSTPEAVRELAGAFLEGVVDRDGRAPAGCFRLLEKTPKNALRVPFFDAAFPDALFVFLYRDVRQTLSSMMEAWFSGRFRTYPRLEGWPGPPWSMLLVPGWRDLGGLPLAEIVARQWAITMNQVIDDLEQIPEKRLKTVNYGDFLAAPQATVEQLAAALDLGWDRAIGERLPLSKTTVSQPRADKWKQIEPVIEAIWPIVAETDERARRFSARLKQASSQPA